MSFNPAITLCSQKELCAHLNVGRDYILAMKHMGFAMPGGRATVNDALTWLKDHPTFSRTEALKDRWPSERDRTSLKRKPQTATAKK